VNFNFFVHAEPDLAAYDAAPMRAVLAPLFAEEGLGAPPAPGAPALSFNDAMLEALLAAAPKVVSFHFGLPSARVIEALKARGVLLIGCATSVAEAQALEAGGMDAIVAQGAEAGGHRGTFLAAPHENDMGTMALTPLVADAVRAPVIAAGGIFDGRGVAAAFALGADGVQLGSAFLRATECTIPAMHKAALAQTPDARTKLTRAFTGRPARSIRNKLTDALAAHEAESAPFPAQRTLTAPLAQAGQARGSDEYHALWSGQAGLRAREAPAAEIFREICEQALKRLART
jgi:nitronate monooxygenase